MADLKNSTHRSLSRLGDKIGGTAKVVDALTHNQAQLGDRMEEIRYYTVEGLKGLCEALEAMGEVTSMTFLNLLTKVEDIKMQSTHAASQSQAAVEFCRIMAGQLEEAPGLVEGMEDGSALMEGMEEGSVLVEGMEATSTPWDESATFAELVRLCGGS